MWCSKSILRISLGLFLCIFLMCPRSYAKKKELSAADEVTVESVTGKISAITDKYVSVVYQEDPENFEKWEMDIPLNKDELEVDGIRSFNSLKVGDTIKVDFNDYKEDYDATDELGQKQIRKKKFGKKGTKIKLIRTGTERNTGEGTLKSK